ncbi:hypothetical protein [Altererythrobacter sp. TH136]|uniref:hypothetical protein n=1 Tax=Altererythrobacter sp. TH136 TaxID=2067415 RepID=UPI0011659F5A|nr:hypothetical protein [Altererythrobacter sp. TH136]QDM40359.1 hypothetical protein C0V74_04330 [Altererythrobacter sp. TH136]
MGQGHQKADHGGNFYMTPRRVVSSVAWRHTSFRARSILDAFQLAFNGRNNGEIAFAIHDIGKAIGNSNHGPNAKAVAELIEKGFLECTSDANRAQSKARTYRITFISTGEPRKNVPATHDYETWRPATRRTFGGVRTTSKNPLPGVETTSTVKVSGVETTSTSTESRRFGGVSLDVGTTPPLYNHPTPAEQGDKTSLQPLKISFQTRAADLRADLETLRAWVVEAVERRGYGGARMLAQDAGISEVALSRFRSGKNLPDQYRIALQEACARAIPFNKLAT